VLVDRLWPRGVSKTTARLDAWARDLAPSTELRQWFTHDEAKWPELLRRYAAELRDMQAQLAVLRERAKSGRVTLLFAARDLKHNNAEALRLILQNRRGD
jgi:uncharacterized protein YeaO (DUF488 family)